MALTDLAQFIQQTPLCDTHEHLQSEKDWISNGPDILSDLFGNYVTADLRTAGASPEAIAALKDSSSGDIEARFEAIRPAWDAARFTGYGAAVRILAREVYGLEDLTTDGLMAAQARLEMLRQPGERYRLLHDQANLDHVQIDNFCWPCPPDESGADFFLYDLNWQGFCSGRTHSRDTAAETGIEVTDLSSLKRAQEAIFARHGPQAIAVKAQHAYGRTLDWRERSNEDAEEALAIILNDEEASPEEARLCLGDWSWEQGVRLAIEYNLPFKIHTGYYAGNNSMPVERIKPGQMFRLLQKYAEARFVLMHIAYPYSDELLAVAKQFTNVWVDLCWAWSIDPMASEMFVRRFLHAVPINKLFAFGGDTSWPTSALAYAYQSRQGLTRALQQEVDQGDLTEREAMDVAGRLMQGSARTCFDIEGTRSELRRCAAAA